MNAMPTGEVVAALGARILARREAHGELTITVATDQILDVLKTLRDDSKCQFEIRIDLAGVDARAFDPLRRDGCDKACH